jgi:hypothetical protein
MICDVQPLPLIRRANTVPILQPYHLPALPRNLRSRVVSVQPKVTRMFDRLLGVDEKDRGDSGEGWKKLVRNLWEVNRWSILTRKRSTYLALPPACPLRISLPKYSLMVS